MTIYVSIAAYRDPQLEPTLVDLFARARWPEALRVGVCWQHGDDEALPDIARDPRVEVIDVPWRESQGACWARAALMERYDGEDFFLQIDSHHRFVEHWDERLMRLMDRCGAPHPVLTAYAPAFSPDDPAAAQHVPTQMNFDRFTEESIILFRPSEMEAWRTRSRPQRARFLSGHFLFAEGRFCEEVPYDPSLYFIGEEISLGVRAYTHGYDLFHPHEVILWHEYTRAYRPHKHWVDHDPAQGVREAWHARDARSKARVRALLNGELSPDDPHGFGARRTLADFERFAGLSFRHRRAQEATRRHVEPPNADAPSDWPLRNVRYDVTASVPRERLGDDAGACDFWFLGFHDHAGREVHRADVTREELTAALATSGSELTLSRTFVTNREVVTWTVWPHHPDRGWREKLTGDAVHARHGAFATFVTALVDLGRAELPAPFGRDLESHYLPALQRLLATPAPMVLFLEARYEGLVWAHRERHNTRVVHLDADVLEGFPWFDAVQEIRRSEAWRAQASWLPDSPQAGLPHYNPMVMSKLLWLDGVARTNPFGTDAVFWIDAGLTHTVPADDLTDPALPERLATAAGDFAAVAFPYEGDEVHGFPTEHLRALAGCARVPRVVRGGLFGGSPDGVSRVAARYVDALQRTLPAGLMGTEESVLTLLHLEDPAGFRVFQVGADGLLAPFVRAVLDRRADRLRLRGDGSVPAVAEEPPRVTGGASREVALVVQTFQSAPQLSLWFDAARDAAPEALSLPTRVLLDNSTHPRGRDEIDALARRHGFTVERHGNLGITGSRGFVAAWLAERPSVETVLHMEDDMLFDTRDGACRNGFRTRVERLVPRALAALRASPDLAFLKLSFTEFYGDHRENWAWHNLGEADRAALFPHGPATRFDEVRAHEGLAYGVGEVFYSNWPALMTREALLALLPDDAPRAESALMVRWLRLARARAWRSGVLFASPIRHHRVHHYAAHERFEG